MTTTIEITVHRRVEVPDAAVEYIDFYLARGIKRVNAAQTVRGLLSSDEELADAFVVGTLTPELTCSLCGGKVLRYDEGVWCSNSLNEDKTRVDEQGVLLSFAGGGNYTEGTSYPGVVCDGCEAVLDLPDNAEIDWS